MNCSWCDELEKSCQTKPANPSGSTIDALFYRCSCGQQWWQTNIHFHLWQRITDKQYQEMREDVSVDLVRPDLPY